MTDIHNTYRVRRCYFEADESNQHLGERNQHDADYNREQIHQRNLGHQHAEASLIRVEYGTWEKQPACLITFLFHFYHGNVRSSRFTRADIHIDFSSRDGAEGEPEIVNYGPKHLLGRRTAAEVTWSFSGSFSLHFAAGPFEMGPEVELTREETFERGYRETVKCFAIKNPRASRTVNQLNCFLDENRKDEDGILEELYQSVVVRHRGPFKAEVEIGTNIMFSLFARPWTADHPVLFQPGVPWGPRVRDDEAMDFAQLTAKEWERLVTSKLGTRCVALVHSNEGIRHSDVAQAADTPYGLW
ncbi:hypothetical protein MRB53_041715 [Persea americana]|nr:hypothetical protein MRB53_041715 [Persea americana]